MLLSRLPPLPEAGADAGVDVTADAAALAEVDLAAQLQAEHQGARVHRGRPPLPSMVAAALPVTKPSLVKAVAAMFGTELMAILRQRRAQMPAVVGVRGLGHVRDGQGIGRGHATGHAEQRPGQARQREEV